MTTIASRSRPEQAVRLGEHGIALVLAAVAVVRAIQSGGPVSIIVVAGCALAGWYLVGAVAIAPRRALGAARWWFGGMVLLWLGAVALSDEFVWWAFVIWLLVGYVLPTWPTIAVAALVYGVTITAPLLHRGSIDFATIIGPLIGGVFAVGISRGYLELVRRGREREELVASLLAAGHEMADLQEELALAQRHAGAIAERTRIARDIHDTVAQGLASIRLLAHAQAETADHDGANAPGGASPMFARWRQVETLAHENLVDARRIIAALSPAELADHALAAAVDRLVRRFGADSGIRAAVHVDPTWPDLPATAEIALLRTIQSALANVRQHARASGVVVSLIDEDDGVRVDIVDDGQGFDVAAWPGRLRATPAGASSGYGLRFIRARLTELGGGLDVESTPGEGTALSAHLPRWIG